MKIKAFLFLFLPLISLEVFAQPGSDHPQNYFRNPLDIPIKLSGTFGELRGNHFHSGVDLKTEGKRGLKVHAAAKGSVSRIKRSVYGFGNALYIRHPNGYTTVYAHLQEFNEEIEAYVKKQQYHKQANEVDLFPPVSKFQVEKGEVVAFSGNSGGSGGPHLHYEIRDTRTEKIINPLLFGYEVPDNRHPRLSELQLYEFKDNELMANQEIRLINRGSGVYRLAGEDVLDVKHRPAFGILAIDKLDGAYNPNGVYSIKMKMDGKLQYDFTMNTFAFRETRYINSHIDYAQKVCCGKEINKLYLEPNNRLSVYGVKEKMNLPDLPADSAVSVKIQVSDIAGNVSEVRFKIKRVPAKGKEQAQHDVPLFRYAQSNYYSQDGVEVVMPSGALYRNAYFEHQILKPCDECLSPVHQVGAEVIPVQRYYTLKIKPGSYPQEHRDKLAIASLQDGRIDDYEGGSFENGMVKCRTRQFGHFAVTIDTVPPVLKALNFSGETTLQKEDELRLKIDDNFSGIDSYNAWYNGKWVRLTYDYKNDLLRLNAVEMQSVPGKVNTLRVTVKDEKQNTTTQTYKLKAP